MKRSIFILQRAIAMLIALCALLSLAACGSGRDAFTSGSSRTERAELPLAEGATEYGLEVFSNEYVTIICTYIDQTGVHFDVKSKLKNNDIDVLIDRIALDGQVPEEEYSETGWLTIAPGETAEMNYGAKIHSSEHATMSAVFTIFNEAGNGTEYSITDFDLGKQSNPECDEPDGEQVHDSRYFSIVYAGADERGIRLRLQNKMDQPIGFVVDVPFTVNGAERDASLSTAILPAHSTSDYYFDGLEFDMDYNPHDIHEFSFSGYIHDGEEIEHFNVSVSGR